MDLKQTKPLQEKKQHGSILFPFNIYPCTIPKDFPSVALHWHKSMEIIYIKKGRGQAQVDLQTMDAEGGDIFILPPGTLHALYGIPGNVMEYEISSLTWNFSDLVRRTSAPSSIWSRWRQAGWRCRAVCRPGIRSMPLFPRALRMRSTYAGSGGPVMNWGSKRSCFGSCSC